MLAIILTKMQLLLRTSYQKEEELRFATQNPKIWDLIMSYTLLRLGVESVSIYDHNAWDFPLHNTGKGSPQPKYAIPVGSEGKCTGQQQVVVD